MNIGLLCAAFPPDLDGIGDYSWWMAKELTADGHEVTIFTSLGETRDVPEGVNVRTCFESMNAKSLCNAARCISEEALDALVIQYNPFGFGRRGFCPGVPRLLKSLRATANRPRIVTMFHELFTGAKGIRGRAMRAWQTYFTSQVSRLSDLRFASCELYADWLRHDGYTAVLLPVPSNLPDLWEMKRTNEGGPLKIGAFGTAHVSRRFDLMHAAARAMQERVGPVQFTFIGSGGEVARQLFEGVSFRATGRILAEEAAKEVYNLDLMLSPFSDGLTARRASAVAGLQAGVPLVSTLGSGTDTFLREARGRALILSLNDAEFIETCVELASDRPRRQELGATGRMLYEERFSRDQVARDLVEVIGGPR